MALYCSVTAEVAGSSPVVPAIPFKDSGSPSPALQLSRRATKTLTSVLDSPGKTNSSSHRPRPTLLRPASFNSRCSRSGRSCLTARTLSRMPLRCTSRSNFVRPVAASCRNLRALLERRHALVRLMAKYNFPVLWNLRLSAVQ